MVSIKSSENKTILITGAAGGLGLALVETFLTAGYYVLAADINCAPLKKYKDDSNIEIFGFDITIPESINKLASEIDEQSLKIDVLVNAAGIYNTYAVTEAGPDLFRKIMDVNFIGQQYVISAFLPQLMKTKGRIIQVSSESVKFTALFQPYMISKIALEAYCTTAMQELKLLGISLSVIRPGAIDTPMMKWTEKPMNPIRDSVFEKPFIDAFNDSLKFTGKSIAPLKVAKKIFKIAESKRPKRFYKIHNNPLTNFYALFPGWLRERIIVGKYRMK